MIRSPIVLDLLARLVDKSLVVYQAIDDGPGCYTLLETLRQYGARRLAVRGDPDDVRNRHAEFFLGLAERLEPELHGHDGRSARTQLELESSNMRAAVRWLSEAEDVDRTQRLVGALARFWFFNGYIDEAESTLTRALAMHGGDRLSRGRAKCLFGLAMTVLARGDPAEMECASREARVIWKQQRYTRAHAPSRSRSAAFA